MKQHLLQLFYDLDQGQRRTPAILDEISRRRGTVFIREYNFNIVDLTLDFEKGIATLWDITDPGTDGCDAMSLEAFEALLRDRLG